MATQNKASEGIPAHPGIPIIDFAPVTEGGDLSARCKVAQELLAKGRVNGCVGLRGTGIPPEMLEEAFRVVKSLFDLPLEDKMKAPHPDDWVPHRGYSGIGREQAAAMLALKEKDPEKKAELEAIKDYKETYEVGSEHNQVQYNIWLPEPVLPGFQSFALGLYWSLHKLAVLVFDTLVASLEVTEDEANAVRALHNGHDDSLRLAHYPPRPAEAADKLFSRLGPHTDWSLFTLLLQDKCSGLEFQDRTSKDFMLAEPLNGVVYMNIGDMFECVSNGIYPSAIHRVTAPQGPDGPSQQHRYSIPYFVVAEDEGLVAPPESLVQRMGESKYEPVKFKDYSKLMYGATNLYLVLLRQLTTKLIVSKFVGTSIQP